MQQTNRAKFLATSFVPLAMAVHAASAGFIPGDLAVMQVGSGSAVSQSTTANPLFIDEYSPTGALVAQYPVPTAASGSNLPIALDANTAQDRGQLSLSTDGQSIVFSGYNAVPGTASITTTPTISAGIGILNVATGTFDTSTSAQNRTSDQIVINKSGSTPPGYAANTRGVYGATMDGSNIWFTSTSSNPYEMGTQLVTRGSVGLPTQVGAPNAAPQGKFITTYNGQLLVSQAAGASAYNSSTGIIGSYYPQQQAIFGPATMGTGLPTTPSTWTRVDTTNGNNSTTYSGATTPAVELAGFPTVGGGATTSINSFAYADGGQTLYVVDGTNGLEKWTLGGSTWALDWTAGRPTLNANCTGVTVTTDGVKDYVYLTDTIITTSGGSVIGSSIYSVADPIGSLTAPTSFNLLASSGSGVFFGGIVAVPEPTSVGFVGLTMLTALGRRRKA